MSLLAVYGHGSFFAGLDDPHDVDVMLVGAADVPPARAARYVPAGARHLPLDASVVTPRVLVEQPICRAVVLSGTLLSGRPLLVEPFTCDEWRAVMLAVAALPGYTEAKRVLALLRAEWAADGRLILPKSAVPAAAEGTAFEALARDAWKHRHDPAWNLDVHFAALTRRD